jgi:cobalt-precorrin-7 (C5)-methyltransferase
MDVKREQPIVIAGCGPGAPELITPAARKAAEAADVLVGARRLLSLFDGVRMERIVVGADVGSVMERVAAIHSSRKIVVLVSGDPGFYSLGRAVLARFGRADCRVIAGVSAVQAAFACIGVSWEDARLVSAHEAVPLLKPEALAESGKIAVLGGNRASSGWINDAVNALYPTHAIFACSDLTLPEERVQEVLQARFDAAKLPSLTVLLFVRRDLLK